jgi:corrinoid protein of di/trimethylamine methyltransferase
MSDEIFVQLTNSLSEVQPQQTVSLTQEALDQGLEPLDIIDNGLIPGMNIVGEKFSSGEFFLPDLIIAAGGMQKAMELLEPELLEREQKVSTAGTIVLGTVQGDIHEIGKSLVSIMLSANGFKVHDLGVDVPIEKFISTIQETEADILGMSALLTTTMIVQREVIQALLDSGIRNNVKVMVGGAPVSKSWADEIGADGYAEDAMGSVTIAKQLME